MTVRDGRVLGTCQVLAQVLPQVLHGVLLGLLFCGVGDGAGAYGWQGARAGAVCGIADDAVRGIMMLSAEPIRTLLLPKLWRVDHDVVNHVMMLLESLRCCVLARCRGNRYNAASWFVAVVCYLGSMLVCFFSCECSLKDGEFMVLPKSVTRPFAALIAPIQCFGGSLGAYVQKWKAECSRLVSCR